MGYRYVCQVIAVLLAVCLMSVLLIGCGQENVPEPSTESVSQTSGNTKATEAEKTVLRVVIESSIHGNLPDSFEAGVIMLERQFRLYHRDVEVVVEKIPKEEGREEVLQRLRTELMMGEGPDVILLPTAPNSRILGTHVEALFPDVQQAVRNGLFMDLGTWYDADTELGSEGLNKTVMDAGLYNGGRYVLPLCYNLPMVCVDKKAFAESGVRQDIWELGTADFLNAVALLEDPADVGSFYQRYYQNDFISYGDPLSFNFFPRLIDYDTGEVAVTREELAEYLWAWQAYRVRLGEAINAGGGISGTDSIQQYYGQNAWSVYWAKEGHFASCGSLFNAPDDILLARSNGVELDMYPLRAMDGSVVADVTMYGAISSGCEHPEIAYAFLREFLTEGFQMDTALETYGWPVRTGGSVQERCSSAYMLLKYGGGTAYTAVNNENVTDEEMPVLNVPIDHVRFSIPLEAEFGDTVISVYDFRSQQATSADIDQLAQDWIKKLQIHVDEG